MKKLTIIMALMLLCMSVFCVPVFAATDDSSTECIEIDDLLQNTSRSSNSTVVLSDGSVSVSLDAPAAVETKSPDSYVTDTQEITIRLKSSKAITVKVSLYRNDGSYVTGTTKDLGTLFKTSWTFTNLNQGDIYYFTVTNLGQRDVSITGTVSE